MDTCHLIQPPSWSDGDRLLEWEHLGQMLVGGLSARYLIAESPKIIHSLLTAWPRVAEFQPQGGTMVKDTVSNIFFEEHQDSPTDADVIVTER